VFFPSRLHGVLSQKMTVFTISEILHVFGAIFECLTDIITVRVPGYRSRGPEFDSRIYQIFLEVMGLERGSISLVIFEELFA
jgi:hypothetical protein